MQNIEEIYNKYSKTVYKYIFCLSKDKEISEERVIDVEEEISRSLGCWVINHKSDIKREENKIFTEYGWRRL